MILALLLMFATPPPPVDGWTLQRIVRESERGKFFQKRLNTALDEVEQKAIEAASSGRYFVIVDVTKTIFDDELRMAVLRNLRKRAGITAWAVQWVGMYGGIWVTWADHPIKPAAAINDPEYSY